MEAVHYSVSELEQMRERAAVAFRQRDHLNVCEQCSYLLALVRRAQGPPSDEDKEVTVDVLKRWVEPTSPRTTDSRQPDNRP